MTSPAKGASEGSDARRVPVRDLSIQPGMSVSDLLGQMRAMGGFSSRHVAAAADIVDRMVREEATVILSFPAAMMATGCRGAIVEMVRRGWVDAIVTTCGTLDHDLARTWRDYYHGAWNLDDSALHAEGVNRLGNVLVPNESYGEILEEKLQPFLSELFARHGSISTARLCRALGERIRFEPKGAQSLLSVAAEHDVPIFVPGIMDGAVGSQVWLAWQKNRAIAIDLLSDEQELYEIVHHAAKLGAIMMGGGISKHHVIWWSQFREGLDFGVYITTAVEWDGSLSGARLEEAISWGKVKEDAKIVNVPGDATLILPLIVAAISR
ncbi:MAG: deoxyhypusine synthase [Thermoplasmatota archaeon]